MPPLPPSKAEKPKKANDKEKDKERKRENSHGHPNERLKTVVRKLPPNLPEDVFWQSVQPWVTEETATWKAYYPGRIRKRLNQENIHSRAYIAFKTDEQLAAFGTGFDGHVFRDKNGVESIAVVEFAPYSKIPSDKRKPDPRNATIEQDEDYISFVESLTAQQSAEPIPLETLIASTRPPTPPKTTPLLEALKAEKSANRDREAILRNHAHYGHPSSRKEEKKKAPAPPRPNAKNESTSGPATPASSKKAAKKAAKEAQAAPPPKILQASKPAPAPANTNASASAPPSTPAAKPPRPPRPPKNKAPPIATSTSQGGSTAPDAATTPTPTTKATTTPSSATAPRRSRPVLGVNRQFDAALSGATGGERKARKEKAPPAPPAISSEPSSSSTAPQEAAEPSKPAPPKKERSRRGKGGGGGGGPRGGGPAANSGPPAQASAQNVPTILQRIDDTPPPAKAPLPPVSGQDGAGGNSAPTPSSSGPSHRGGGRGRGRGRGRGGGPPNPPRTNG